jgi:H+/Cl- antiporter ClcA
MARGQCSWRSATGCLSHGRDPVSAEDGGDPGGAARRRGGRIANPGAGGGLASLLLCALWQSGFLAEIKAVSLWWGGRVLAASMQMPLTAVALVMEFTHMDHSYLAPTLLCAAGAFLTCRIPIKNIASEINEKRPQNRPSEKYLRLLDIGSVY